MLGGGCPFERDIIDQHREKNEQHKQRKAAAEPMAPLQREASCPCAGASDEDDVQWWQPPTIVDMPLPGSIMPKPPPLSPIADIFERDSQIASWTARLKQEQALTAVIRREVPRPLAERVRVAGIRGTVLELAVSAGAVATVIRQRTPDMTTALRREGWDFTEIRIRVQAPAAERRPEKKLSHQMDTDSATALFRLADSLPDSPLKQSLTRWKRRARGR